MIFPKHGVAFLFQRMAAFSCVLDRLQTMAQCIKELCFSMASADQYPKATLTGRSGGYTAPFPIS